MDSHLYLTFFLCLLCRVSVSQLQRCSLKTCAAATTTNSSQESEVYDLKLFSQEYSTTLADKGKVKISVKMLANITLETPGVKYYKIVASTKESSDPAGTFNTPSQSSEAELCGTNTIVFHSCEPRVTDLLRTYEWNAPATVVGDVCFRLSILRDGDNETCEYVTKCISPIASPEIVDVAVVGLSLQTSQEQSLVEPSQQQAIELSSHDENCYKKRNCTTAKLKTFCATNGKEYQSRCHVRLDACLTRDSTIRVEHSGECLPPPPPTPPPEGPCFNETKLILNNEYARTQGWIPSCDCNGYFKPVQCNTNNNQCWCSTKRGAQISQRVRLSEATDFTSCLNL